MVNDPKTDLIFAILAMDAYNRGYGSGITDLLEVAEIGSWSILTTSTDEFELNAFNAGFYAIAYRNADTGETVISYRGTDFNFNNPFLFPFILPNPEFLQDPVVGGSDLVNGYGIALGETQGAQAVLAAQFYRNVTGAASDGTTAANVNAAWRGAAFRFSSKRVAA